jgi:hypothetical protein
MFDEIVELQIAQRIDIVKLWCHTVEFPEILGGP